MITGDYVGGLGNQLFIVASTIAFARSVRKPFGFEKKSVSPSISHRTTYFDSVFKNLPLYDPSVDHRKLVEVHEHDFYRAQDGLRDSRIDTYIHILKGYFQDYRYFDEYKNDLLTIFEIPAWKKNVLALLPSPSTKRIGIHFRMGDYKVLQAHFRIIGDDYYRHALHIIGSRPDHHPPEWSILVFCEEEDEPTVRNRMLNILPDGVSYRTEFIRLGHDFKDMIAISLCDEIIIANSTFSWWGAYFADHDRVIVPSSWFREDEPTPLSMRYPMWTIVNG